MTSTKIDLTNYSDDELSLQVFNIELFYKQRNIEPLHLHNILSRHFNFTGNQWSVLQKDIVLDSREQ